MKSIDVKGTARTALQPLWRSQGKWQARCNEFHRYSGRAPQARLFS